MRTSPLPLGLRARLASAGLAGLAGLAGALAACDDTAGSGAGAPDVTVRLLPDVGPDGGPDTGPVVDATLLDVGVPVDQGSVDMQPDGPPPVFGDFEPRPDAAACTLIALASDDGGQAALEPGAGDVTTASGADFWRITVVDARGRPLPAATASFIIGADAFTLVVHAPGHLAAVLNAPKGDGTYGINAARQAVEGPGAKEVLGASEVPACAAGTRFVSVVAALAPLPPRITRDLVGDALADACARGEEPPESPACAALAGLATALGEALPARLRLAADTRPEFLAAGAAALEGPAAGRLAAETCGTPWGVVPLGILDAAAFPEPEQTPLARWRRLATAFEGAIRRVAPDAEAQRARLLRFGVALSHLDGVVRPADFELVGPVAGLAGGSALARAGEAVRALVAAGDVTAPAFASDALARFAATGPAPAFDAFGHARSAQPAGAYGLGPAALCDLGRLGGLLDFNAGLEIESHAGVDALLDVLEAVRLDDAPAPDAGLPPAPDAAVPPDAGLPPVPDAGPVGACGPDDQEPNQTWEQEVRDDQRQPRNVSGLDRLTLEPGDVDWYVFESGLINPHLSATISAEPLCERPGGRLCAELQWWTWAYAEGLLDDRPFTLVERTCADIADGIVLDAGGIGGLAGEPWTSMVVHVTEDAAAPLAAPLPYRIRVTR